jgi:hypothetical protein
MTQIFNIPPYKKLEISTQHMLIVVDEKDYKPEVEGVLKAIITAIKKDFETDILVLILESGQSISLGAQLQKFTDLVFFGVNPTRVNLNINAKMYKIFSFEHQILFISHPLTSIAKDVEKKKILWNLLQYQYLSSS